MVGATAVVLLGSPTPPLRWPLRKTPPALAPIANRAVVAHQIDALHRLGFERVAVAGDEAEAERVQRALASAGVDPESILYLSLGAIRGRIPLAPAAGLLAADAPLVLLEAAVVPGPDLADVVAQVRDDPGHSTIVALHTGDDIGPKVRMLATVIGRPALVALADADPSMVLSSGGISETLRHEGLRLFEWAPSRSWLNIERAENLLDANRALLDLVAAGDPRAFAQRAEVQGAVVLDETATLDYSTVRGPAIIGAGAFIADSYVGPYTSIGEGVVIEASEVESSIVGSNAIIRELGVRLQDSVIGSGAVVTCDPQVPRALRVMVGEDARISLS
jgi:glucose-1-phosphate thymidylyltransferase